MPHTTDNREAAAALDAADPLARFRDAFHVADPDLLYLDGNSLGRLPHAARSAVHRAVEEEWGAGLVRSWHQWIDLPQRIGDVLAPVIGARAGEVVLCDQTSINLFKLATAGLAHTGRTTVVGDDSNFPSDRYVLQSVAAGAGGSYREAQVDPVDGPTVDTLRPMMDDSVGILSLSMVSFKSGAIVDVEAITALAHEHGALILWDLSHAAGAIPVALEASGADLAVGCTYKHLNGGPGAPAFLFVRRELQEQLTQPIPGWFGHDDMFAFESAYRPAPDIRRFTIGTPPILSMRAAEAGIQVTAEAGIDAVRRKNTSLTELLLARAEARLLPLGFAIRSPQDSARRAGHVSLAHEHGFQITQAVIDRGVVPDFRAPDLIRLGIAPLYNSHVEIYDAIERLAEVVEGDAYRTYPAQHSGGVT